MFSLHIEPPSYEWKLPTNGCRVNRQGEIQTLMDLALIFLEILFVLENSWFNYIGDQGKK